MPKNKMLNLIIVSALLGGAAFVYQNSAGSAPATVVSVEKKVIELAPSEVMTLAPQKLAESISISGSIEPIQTVLLKSELGGMIENVSVKEGDDVKKGDTLLALRSKELAYDVAKVKAEAEGLYSQKIMADQNLQRVKKLREGQIESAANLQKAENEAAVAQMNYVSKLTEVRNAEVTYAKATTRAPFSGTISEVHVKFGETIGQTTDLFRLVDVSQMEMKSLISTRDIYRLKIGDVATLKVEGVDGQEFKAEIVRMSPSATAGSRSVPIFLSVKNPAKKLWGGSFVTGSLAYKTKDHVLAVPANAIRHDDQPYVLKVSEGVLVKQPVDIEDKWHEGDLIEVEGLEEGETIVSASLPDLKPGATVELASE